MIVGAYNALLTVAALLGWFSALARGRMPRGLRNAGALALRYQAQTFGYLLLLSDAYPYSGPLRGDGALSNEPPARPRVRPTRLRRRSSGKPDGQPPERGPG